MCLGLEVDASHILAQFPVYDIQDTIKIFLDSSTGLSPFIVDRSRSVRQTLTKIKNGP